MGFELIRNSEGTIAGCVESENGTLTEQQANDAILCNKENPTESEIKEAQDALDVFSGYALLRIERNKKLAQSDWMVLWLLMMGGLSDGTPGSGTRHRHYQGGWPQHLAIWC